MAEHYINNTKFLCENYKYFNTMDFDFYVLYICAKKGLITNSDKVLNRFEPLLYEQLFAASKAKAMRYTDGYIACIQYPDEFIAYYIVRRMGGYVNMHSPVYQFVLQHYRIQNIISILKKYDKFCIDTYFGELSYYFKHNINDYIDFCEEHNMQRCIRPIILKNNRIDTATFIRITNHLIANDNISMSRIYLFKRYKKIDHNDQLVQFLENNKSNYIIYSIICNDKRYSHLCQDIVIDSKIICISQYIENINFMIDAINEGRFVKATEPTYIHYGEIKHKDLSILALDNDISIVQKDCHLYNSLCWFHIKNKELFRAVADNLYRHYPNLILRMEIIENRYNMWFSLLKKFEIVLKSASAVNSRIMFEESLDEGEFDAYLEMIANGRLIINSANLIINNPEFISVVMQRRETFLRYHHKIEKMSAYRIALNRNMKSAAKV